MAAGHGSGDSHRSFGRFGAARIEGEQVEIARGDRRKLLHQLGARFGRAVTQVAELADLALDRGNYFWIGVADPRTHAAMRDADIVLAVHVLEGDALARSKADWHALDPRQYAELAYGAPLVERAALRAWNRAGDGGRLLGEGGGPGDGGRIG